ncbi:CPBP family intramembrane glutamic endopeptidase [Chroococcus sp. FPU101]|uniref:CPBP family intramembrane glutamic endopeptidase n=1 Tax=Chroococcus sp. FPU101 TaxID=1974212 RepID=UPI001A8D2150|nr:CPBP family intramembrane glutamic endopeptidase [Chroococcus sp. FPU101]GFE69808.1 Abortive infection protein [Chroococcus sp. FPU101]
MTIKKILIVIVTIISLFPVILALVSSVNQPQVQSNLQLYQTNLILQAAELSEGTGDLGSAQNVLLGANPYATAKSQYQEVKNLTQENIKISSNSLKTDRSDHLLNKTKLNVNSEQQELEKQINQDKVFLKKVDVSLGIIEAKQGNTVEAINIWDNLIKTSDNKTIKSNIIETATVLKALWNQPLQVLDNSETVIQTNLKGWFRNQALKQLYQIENRKTELLSLQNQDAQIANQAIIKLALVGGIPIISGLLGIGILVILITQRFLQGKSAILAVNNDLAWETPWDWEVIWSVLIAGFFLIGQIILPVAFGIIGSSFKLSVASLDLRYKAVYVLISYLTMAITGILVLYFSIKPFFPLPKNWFKLNVFSNWILWGLGGYFVAFPLVVIISLVNQQIWHGLGGSNPLLLLALESQDKIALIIFFITASVAAPFFEEVIFRGFLLPSLTRYLPVWGAIVVSSLIFALAHLNLSEVLPLATLGIVLGFVYTRSKNLLSSMLLHSLWNSGTLISLFILGSGNS